jgi:predicted RND superfamily exporter protein
MEKLAHITVKYRWLIIILVLIFTGFFGYQLKYLKVDSNIVDSLPKDDSVVRLFKEVGDKYGGNQLGIIILKSNNVLSPETLESIKKITDALSNVKGVIDVTSLTNMMSLNVEGDNFLVGKLINDNNRPKNMQQADSLVKILENNKMVSGNILSKDGTVTAIIFTFGDNVDINVVAGDVMKKIKKLHIPEKYYFGGTPFLTKYVDIVIAKDLMKLIPISFILIALVLYISFHSFKGIVLPILTSGLAILWSMGVFSLLGLKLSMVSNNVPIIILAVGSAYAIHVLNRITQCKEVAPERVIAKALSYMIIPVSLSALTTVSGFLSFIFGSYLIMIRDFGILAALGTFFSALLALTFVPSLMAMFPGNPDHKKKDDVDIKSKMQHYVLEPLNRMVENHSLKVLVVWVVLFVISITGVFMLKRSVSVSGYFKKNHPAAVADRIMSEKLGGSKPVFVVFKGDLMDPEVLNAMAETEKYMVKSPYIKGAQSIADVVVNMNKAVSGEEKIPDTKAQVQQLWFLIGQNESVNRLVTPELNQGIILAKFNDNGNYGIDKFNKYMESWFAKHKSKNYSVQITGMPFVNAKLDKSLLRSQIGSLIIAIIMVFILVSLMFWSIYKGLLATITIIVTVAILYGLMGWVGIPLNVVTVLVASVAIGIGVDYSIHFISYFNDAIKKLKTVEKAVEDTMYVSGKAILINFLSVSVGFLVLVFSDFVPIIYFGVLIALSMLGSSMGALTLLPSILLITDRKIKKLK